MPTTKATRKTWSINIDRFLSAERKRRDRVKGDGNCLFRALSKQLFGAEAMYKNLRMYLTEVINEHSEIYSQYFIPNRNTRTFEEHKRKLQIPGTWGTQLELQAISECYQLPVYVCSPHPESGIYRWLIFRPMRHLLDVPSKANLPEPSLPHTENHIQLAHTGCHYDSVVSSVGLDQRMDCPDLPDQDEEFELRIISSGSDSEGI